MTTFPTFRDLLILSIGQPAVDAVRALDAGEDPKSVYLRHREATLPPMLASAMKIARTHGTVSSAELREVDPNASPSTLSNRLNQLKEWGLLVPAYQVVMRKGGRRLVFAPWDGLLCKECHEVMTEKRGWININGHNLCPDCFRRRTL